MNDNSQGQSIREAVAVFFDTMHLEQAISDLKSSGFSNEELGLLASEFSVTEKLGHIYTDINKDQDSPDAPNIAFVAKDSVGDTAHAFLGSLYIFGAAVTGGAVVATMGILGGAVATAIATTAAVGGVAAVLGNIIKESDAEYLEEQVDEGHLLLFVRTRNAELEKQAIEILSRHSGFDPRIHTVPLLAT